MLAGATSAPTPNDRLVKFAVVDQDKECGVCIVGVLLAPDVTLLAYFVNFPEYLGRVLVCACCVYPALQGASARGQAQG